MTPKRIEIKNPAIVKKVGDGIKAAMEILTKKK